jgi:signal transduction histidine kinase
MGIAGAPAGQSASPWRPAPPGWAPWAAAWGAVVLLAVWLEALAWGWLLAAALLALFWTVAGSPRRESLRMAGGLLLWIALGAAGYTQLRLDQVESQWSTLRPQLESATRQQLLRAFSARLEKGRSALDGAESALAEAQGASRAELFRRMESARGAAGVAAVALFDREGEPLLWAGEHRGTVPLENLRGEAGTAFADGPLFGYLYSARPHAGGTLVAAHLLQASVEVRTRSFADRFLARQGVRPLFHAPHRGVPEGVELSVDGRVLAAVELEGLTQDRWRERVAGRGRGAVSIALALAFLVLSLSWFRGAWRPPALPVALGALALLAAPLGSLPGVGPLFSPLHFVLPLGGTIALGDLLVVLAAAGTWLLGRNPEEGARRAGGWLPRLLGAAAALALVNLAAVAAMAPTATSYRALGPATVFLLPALGGTLALFFLARPPVPFREPTRYRGLWLALAISLSLTLSLGLALAWTPGHAVSPMVAALWAFPFLGVLAALRGSAGRGRLLAAWLACGSIAAAAAFPPMWTHYSETRVLEAEAELARLGSETDPYLDFLLRQFGEEVRARAALGHEGVDLLYRSWLASGLAREGYEARLTLWEDEGVVADLRLTDLETLPELTPEISGAGREMSEARIERFTRHPSVHYLALVPLETNQRVTVAVPPRRRLARATALARFLSPEAERAEAVGYESLTFVPEDHPELFPGSGEVMWIPSRAGWRSETIVSFADSPAHAHLELRAAHGGMLVVRGLLFQSLALAALLLLWAAGRSLGGEPLGVPEGWRMLARSFRARLTAALFFFVMAPTALFGAVTYGAVTREVARTSGALALHSLEQAAPTAPAEPLPMAAERVRTDLLFYRNGQLVDASSSEILDLGLFEGWLPPAVHLELLGGEVLSAVESRVLGGGEYQVAYRRVAPGQVLATPTPLAEGEIAWRQREFGQLLLLLGLVGAALSVLLALVVGRALATPLEQLAAAAGRVGRGRLDTRLPEDREDEFGGVFRAFNRMVRGLRRARTGELRSARVLAWGEMARQVAHEIKNPLTPIKLSVQHLRRAHRDRRPDFEEILERNVDSVLREIERLGEIARAFARFGTPPEAAGPLEEVDVVAVTEETLALYRGAQPGIEYRLEEEGRPLAEARSGELKEVLINLLENAREAVHDEGTITVLVAASDRGEEVRLEVADDGEGIPEEALGQIFEPHFSSRTSGTGLGLAIVRRLVESWGGEVSAASVRGEGTVMRLRLRSASRKEGSRTVSGSAPFGAEGNDV